MSMMVPTQSGRPATAQQQQQRKPFRYNTRQRFRSTIGTAIPITFGGQGSVLLPQIGELTRIFLFVGAAVTDPAAAPAVSAATFGPWNLLKRVQVISNQGSSNIFDCSGYGAYQLAKSRELYLDYKTALTGVTNDPLYQYPTTFAQNVAKNVSFVLVIPVSANYGKNFGLGAINLQAPEVRVNVQIQFGSAADLYSTTDAITIAGNVQVAYEFFEIPPASRNVALPPLIAHRCLEDRFGFANTGDITYQIPRGGKLLRTISTISANGAILTGGGTAYQGTSGATAPSAGLDRFVLKLNTTDEVYQRDYIWNRVIDRQYLGPQELDAGSYLLELWGAEGEPAVGDFRDQLDTEAITTIQAIYSINSGVALGSGNNFIDIVREIWQPLAPSAAGGA